jgi:hypothetical protein
MRSALYPRREHGYCVDDVPAGWSWCHEPEPGPTARRLARCYLAFVLDALDPTGGLSQQDGRRRAMA